MLAHLGPFDRHQLQADAEIAPRQRAEKRRLAVEITRRRRAERARLAQELELAARLQLIDREDLAAEAGAAVEGVRAHGDERPSRQLPAIDVDLGVGRLLVPFALLALRRVAPSAARATTAACAAARSPAARSASSPFCGSTSASGGRSAPRANAGLRQLAAVEHARRASCRSAPTLRRRVCVRSSSRRATLAASRSAARPRRRCAAP